MPALWALSTQETVYCGTLWDLNRISALIVENTLGSQWVKSPLYASLCRLRHDSEQFSVGVERRLVGGRVF